MDCFKKGRLLLVHIAQPQDKGTLKIFSHSFEFRIANKLLLKEQKFDRLWTENKETAKPRQLTAMEC